MTTIKQTNVSSEQLIELLQFINSDENKIAHSTTDVTRTGIVEVAHIESIVPKEGEVFPLMFSVAIDYYVPKGCWTKYMSIISKPLKILA